MEDNKILLKGRLDGKQRNRLKGLLDMMYRPRELAQEIGINQNQIYIVYIPLGCPFERDQKTNHIWMNGKDFRIWYEKIYKKRKPESGEIYCPSCKSYQVMDNVVGMNVVNDTVYNLFLCPNCGKKVSRFIGKRGG